MTALLAIAAGAALIAFLMTYVALTDVRADLSVETAVSDLLRKRIRHLEGELVANMQRKAAKHEV